MAMSESSLIEMIRNIVKSLIMAAGDIVKKSAVNIPIKIAGRNS
jgi:hypothetical protein